MSLLVSGIRLTPDQDESGLKNVVADLLLVPPADLRTFRILRRSVDARHDVRILYQVEISCRGEDRLYQKNRDRKDLQVRPVLSSPPFFSFPKRRFSERPVVVGFGPAGIFASLILARAGAEPIILERGKSMPERVRDVEDFWRNGRFRTEDNVCFGEGGAGTFSDGKLTTRKRDPAIRFLLQELVEAGAPPEILYDSKPHIGTDRLRRVIVSIREKIEKAGGEIRFGSRVTDLIMRNHSVCGVMVNGKDRIQSERVILAPGHGAGDTFEMLVRRGVAMVPKPLAIGVRVEHPQELIDRLQYGGWAGHRRLSPADYRLTFRDRVHGRGVYSFCMCPGGHVIAANPESGSVVTNGMSNARRDSGYANSGLVVTVRPEDFGDSGPLAGLLFLRQWERKAFQTTGGTYFAPAQRMTDFLNQRVSSTLPDVTYRPGVVSSNLADHLPGFVVGGLTRALRNWGRKMAGFVSEEAVLIGVETRTSSPLRLVRGEDYASISVRGLYPVGEGAGYAGGIISSALDGAQCARSLLADT